MNSHIDKSLLPASHIELLRAIHTIDISDEARVTLANAMDKVSQQAVRRKRILDLVQEGLGQLRLDMKYIMFDLDATRRERDLALEKK